MRLALCQLWVDASGIGHAAALGVVLLALLGASPAFASWVTSEWRPATVRGPLDLDPVWWNVFDAISSRFCAAWRDLGGFLRLN